MLKVREVNDFYDLASVWNNLLKHNLLGDNVFLTLEWLSTWWKHFGDGRKLLLLAVEEGEKVIALAPLMLSKYKLSIFGTFKKIEFLGTRHSDYNNFIILEKEKECLKLIVDYLTSNVASWDWIELKEIPETIENAGYLKNLFSNVPFNLKLNKRICNKCPYVSLPASFDLLIKSLSKNMRQNLNKYLRKVKEKHRVELKRYDEAGFQVKEAMKYFFDLHSKRWASKGLPGAFKENTFINFHLDIAECFDGKGLLGLYFLVIDDKLVAVQYNFEYNEKMYYYLAGFDPHYSIYSVGNLLTMFILDRCIQKGYKEYDMMRGDEPYKFSWTNTFRRNFEIRLLRNGLVRNFYNWLTWSGSVNSLAEKLSLSLRKEHV